MIDYKIIRSLRQKRNMTLQELAKKADISVSYLSEIELGKKQPSLETINKLSQASTYPVKASYPQTAAPAVLVQGFYFSGKKRSFPCRNLQKKWAFPPATSAKSKTAR